GPRIRIISATCTVPRSRNSAIISSCVGSYIGALPMLWISVDREYTRRRGEMERIYCRLQLKFFLANHKATPDVEQDHSANDRQDKSCWVERYAFGWSAEDARNEAANDRPCDAEYASHENAEMLGARHDQSRNGAYNDADNKHPQEVQHRGVLS